MQTGHELKAVRLEPSRYCGLRGPLVLPEVAILDGQLIAFDEDNYFLHCVITNSGMYYGVYKSEDPNHLYQHLLRLNKDTQRGEE